MIPQAYITEWSHTAPWPTDEQVEQDLVICRALVEISSESVRDKSIRYGHISTLPTLHLTFRQFPSLGV